jgi:hypothetical protein
MSLATNVSDLATRIATEIKVLRNAQGSLASLSTVQKTNLVAAINELAASIGGAGAQINDAATNTTSVWSSSKTSTQISTAVSALVASAPTTLDTLDELAAALGDDANFATTTATALGNRVRVDAAQAFNTTQQGQARTNIAAAAATHTHAGADVAAATATTVGVVELATTAEATTGTDTTRAVTPAGLKTVADTKAALSHTHTASQISDSTTVGRSVLTATDAAAARTAIGAGTSSVVIGTTAGTAADAAAVGSTTTDFVAVFEAGLL